MWKRGAKKYRPSMGIAFNEENEMKMLSNMAKEGWRFYSFSKLGYWFKKVEPQELVYCMDTRVLKKSEQEQYFELFEESGWTYVTSYGNSMHFFCASIGTTPIYTDRQTTAEKHRQSRDVVLKGAATTAIITIGSFIAEVICVKIFNNDIIQSLIGMIGGGAMGLTAALAVTGIVLNSKIKKSN